MSKSDFKTKDKKFEYFVGERVLCFEPDESKARVLYNAKVIGADSVKDNNGRKVVEYKIHFQGWNNTWDRWADETFVLKDTEENRKLQRKLARRAIRTLKKGKKRHHLPGVAGDSKRIPDAELGEESSSEDESIASSVGTSGKGVTDTEEEAYSSPPEKKKKVQLHETILCATPSPQNSVNSGSDLAQRTLQSTPATSRSSLLEIPHPLQKRLEEDEVMINKRRMIVDLPTSPCVVQILENYVKYFAINIALSSDKLKSQMSYQQGCADYIPPEKRISLCQEVCTDIRILFDFCLPIVLLYFPEIPQFKRIVETVKIINKPFTSHEHRSTQIYSKHHNNHNEKNLNDGSFGNDLIQETSEYENRKPSDQHPALNGETIKSKLSNIKKKRHKKLKAERRTAEDDLIEETHKYLLPTAAMRECTGLSSDAQGRRRSRRLSACDSQKVKEGEHMTFENHSSDAHLKQENTSKQNTTSVNLPLPAFLRKIKKSKSGIPPLNGMSLDLCSVDKYMTKEQYLDYAGNDTNRIVELSRVWDWKIFPFDFQPQDGAQTPPSLIYGIHHFLRLFVKLPDILTKMDIPDFKLKVLTKHLQCLLRFIKEYEAELFEFDCYVDVPV